MTTTRSVPAHLWSRVTRRHVNWPEKKNRFRFSRPTRRLQHGRVRYPVRSHAALLWLTILAAVLPRRRALGGATASRIETTKKVIFVSPHSARVPTPPPPPPPPRFLCRVKKHAFLDRVRRYHVSIARRRFRHVCLKKINYDTFVHNLDNFSRQTRLRCRVLFAHNPSSLSGDPTVFFYNRRQPLFFCFRNPFGFVLTPQGLKYSGLPTNKYN